MPFLDQRLAYACKSGFRCPLTCIDPITDFPDAIHLGVKTASHMGMQFENLWLSRYPRPVRCLHDCGTTFMGTTILTFRVPLRLFSYFYHVCHWVILLVSFTYPLSLNYNNMSSRHISIPWDIPKTANRHIDTKYLISDGYPDRNVS